MENNRVWLFSCWVVLLLLYSCLTTAWTLQEVTQIALADNKDLKVARYNVAIAKARLIQAGLCPQSKSEFLKQRRSLI